MRAASSIEIENIIKLANNCFQNIKPSLVANLPNIIIPDLRDCHGNSSEISQFSNLYLEQRRKAVGGILGNNAFSYEKTALIVVPVSRLFAFTCHEKGQSFVVLSLGLLELLRFEAAISILQSYFQKSVLCVQKLEFEEDAINSFQKMIEMGESMFGFLQASAILYFIKPGYLPRIEDYLDKSLRDRITIVLEPCLIFIILHELGHIDFQRNQANYDLRNKTSLEFPIEENINHSKAEELFADRFALQSVPLEFRPLLVHGSLFFFNIHNYFEALIKSKPEEHPLSLNRISILYKQLGYIQLNESISDIAVTKAIETGKNFWNQLSALDSFTIERKIEYLQNYVQNTKEKLNFEFFTMILNRFYLEYEREQNLNNSKD
jgi:hypothetical protein